jgi:hypothetical protein
MILVRDSKESFDKWKKKWFEFLKIYNQLMLKFSENSNGLSGENMFKGYANYE